MQLVKLQGNTSPNNYREIYISWKKFTWNYHFNARLLPPWQIWCNYEVSVSLGFTLKEALQHTVANLFLVQIGTGNTNNPRHTHQQISIIAWVGVKVRKYFMSFSRSRMWSQVLFGCYRLPKTREIYLLSALALFLSFNWYFVLGDILCCQWQSNNIKFYISYQ